MSLSEINKREKDFHNKLQSATGKRKEDTQNSNLYEVQSDFIQRNTKQRRIWTEGNHDENDCEQFN